MVVEYLLKIKKELNEKLLSCKEQLTSLDLQYKENKRFISLLEESDDPYFEAFSPRYVNRYQKLKLKDLYEEQKLIISKIEDQNSIEVELHDKIDELNNVISEAKNLVNK